MHTKINLNSIYEISSDVVAREIEGELIIVPITADLGDLESDLLTINRTGKAIWEKIDGNKSLKSIASELDSEYSSPLEEIEKDIIGFAEELIKRKIIIERPK